MLSTIITTPEAKLLPVPEKPMATLTFICSAPSLSSSSSTFLFNRTQKRQSVTIPLFPNRISTQNPILQLAKKSRALSVVTRAGPGTSSYIFAFVFPLSLLAVTIFSSMKIADQLDEKFLEELAVNEAILEEEEGDVDGISIEEKPAVPRMRNRPKREVEVSS